MDPGRQCYDGGVQGVWKRRRGTKLNLGVKVREGFLEEEVISELTSDK